MKNKTAINGYADPKQQRLVAEKPEYTPVCGICDKILTWSEEIADGLCPKCKKETFGKVKVNDW